MIAMFEQALFQLLAFDEALREIVGLTLLVSLSALFFAVLFGLPLAAWLALSNSCLRRGLVLLIHALMSFPPVVAGLFVYLLLSRQGALGFLGVLFTPTAMIVAQFVLIFPIVCGLSYHTFVKQRELLSDLFFSLGLSHRQRWQTLLYESRFQLLGALVAGLGRGLAEVGAVMIVGGNILHHTRTLTTGIVLETGKGELVTAMSLGLILLMISLALTALMAGLNHYGRARQYRWQGQG